MKLLRLIVFVICNALSLGLLANDSKIPVVVITDLYHPYQDPGDNLDLINAFSLQDVDLKAVILDIDETLLDNSPFMAEMSINHNEFSPELWEEWSKMEKAVALPGAVDFIRFALENNVEVFYVSNRLDSELQWTLNNMKALGFPEIPAERFYLKTTTSDKKMRRDSIMQNYSVVLFIGDNLADFSNDFDDRKTDYAKGAVDANAALFGTRYVIIPNPTYGGWEKPLYDKSETPKFEQRRKLMISYEDLK